MFYLPNREGMDGFCSQNLQIKAKRYSSVKYLLAIGEISWLVLLLILFQSLGISKFLIDIISGPLKNRYLVILIYLLLSYAGYLLLNLPLELFRSFVWERHFGLSTQTLRSWLKDYLKTGLISWVILVIIFEVFYYSVNNYPNIWWIIFSAFWIFFNLIFTRLFGVLILPLFFKYKPISDNALRERIVNLANKMNLRILDVFEIDFSKKTTKANAGLIGWGKTMRVILTDTLKDRYSPSEIEVILAHEFAHYKSRHIFKFITVNSLLIMLSFYLIFKTNIYFLSPFGLSSLSDISSFPVLVMYIVFLSIILRPLQNYISRRFERQADLMALRLTGLKDSFVSMMHKLSLQNLSDVSVHPVIKFLFFDHPSVEERIKYGKSF